MEIHPEVWRIFVTRLSVGSDLFHDANKIGDFAKALGIPFREISARLTAFGYGYPIFSQVRH